MTPSSAEAWARFQGRAAETLRAIDRLPAGAAPAPRLNDPPELELVFAGLYQPVADRGLQATDALRALEGHVVRVSGYMVREEQRQPGLVLLAPQPGLTAGRGCSADIPLTAVHIVFPDDASDVVPYRPGRVTVQGRLTVAPRVMPDGRASMLQLHLDPAERARFFPEAPR